MDQNNAENGVIDNALDPTQHVPEGSIDWVGLLRGALMDEKAAPDLLVFKEDIVGAVTEMAKRQAERIAAMESDPDVELERIVYERDLQRTRWLIKAYYRTRIRKIEAHVQHYLHHQEYTSRLSAAELEYAKDFFTCIGRHAHQVVLKDLPQHFQSFTLSSAASTEEDMIPAPDLNRTVMMRPAFESARIAISAESEDPMTVYPGDIVVIQYNLIKEQLLQEEVRLT